MSNPTSESSAAALRIAFYDAIDAYPRHLSVFLSEDGERAFRAWWNQFYAAVRDSTAGLKLLSELETLRQRVRELEARHVQREVRASGPT